jgi:hypothetical protein
MAPQKVSGTKLKQALNKFGSLDKAVEGLRQERAALGKSNSQLKEENARLKATRDELLLQVNESNRKLNDLKNEVHSLATKINENKRQYQLFEGFLIMMGSSPSVTGSIDSVIAALQKTRDPGWYTSGKIDELKTLFVRTTMGDYLRCFRCDYCGAKFMVNKEPHYKCIYNYYICPSCHNAQQVKADDSFLKAMVTEEQLENTRRVEELQNENDVLRPLKAFLSVPCEICGQAITKWSEGEVKMAISGHGWGHIKCWNSSTGQLRLTAKILPKFLKDW